MNRRDMFKAAPLALVALAHPSEAEACAFNPLCDARPPGDGHRLVTSADFFDIGVRLGSYTLKVTIVGAVASFEEVKYRGALPLRKWKYVLPLEMGEVYTFYISWVPEERLEEVRASRTKA